MDITVESDNSNEDGFEIPLQQRSPKSQNIALAHINQRAIQRQSVTSEGSSNVANTIALMNAQAIIDTTPSTTGTSSSPHQSAFMPHILRNAHPNLPSEVPATTAVAATYRPNSSNFGLERCEREALHRQNLAVQAMQNVASYHITDAEARAMLIAADNIRAQSWLMDDNTTEEAREMTPTASHAAIATRTRSRVSLSAHSQIRNSRPSLVHQHDEDSDHDSDYDDCGASK